MKISKYIIAILTVLLVSINTAQAISSRNVATQKKSSDAVAQEVIATNPVNQQIEMLSQRYISHVQSCTPFHFSTYLDLYGLKVSLKADINGWNADKKCDYYLSANIGGIGDDIREVFGVNIQDADIAKIKPVITCGFDQSQLDMIAAALQAKQEKNTQLIEEMLKKPEKAVSEKKQTLTPEEEKAAQMIVTSGACQIQNQEELMKQFSDLMNKATKSENL